MLHGLLWFPLLGVFLWLAWAGWNEYQKVEGYRVWAQQFDRSKYDIRSALGQTGDRLVWGVPSRKGLVDRQELALQTVKTVQLRVDGQVVDLAKPPENGKTIVLELLTETAPEPTQIPFTEVTIAVEWAKSLQGGC
ncbi:hypothetical protein ACN4EG_03925 [Alkalinema pantanalense CENA528]|uniref:hypothetical protein n=1 Tax=Alkalinema pantanalense TaxID=1620705 RepID=UPI003D6E365C